jgi:phage terminase large subunit GpA-like protein
MQLNPVAWAEKHFWFDRSSTTQGRFEISRAPFLRDLMEAFADPSIRTGTCMCSAQSAKTQTGIILACWAESEDPGPFMWVMPAKDEAVTFSTTRLKESFEKCSPVSRLMPSGRYQVKNLEINFATAPLILVGAQSGSKLSGKPIRWLFLDEEKDYKLPGAVEKAIKRTRSKWNSKVWRMCTPGSENDSIHLAFLAGDQRHWHVRCPKCGHSEPLRWKYRKGERGYLRYDEADNEQAVIDSVRYECPNLSCDHEWRDTPEDRSYIAGEGGEWVRHNLKAKPSDASWTWNALLPAWVSWGDLVSEWRKAQKAKRALNMQPLKVFLNESACEPFKEEYSAEPVSILGSDYRLSDYTSGQLIDGEARRVMTIDKQQAWYWVIIRAWRNDGSSRLLYFGKIQALEQLEELRIRYGVLPKLTHEDASYRDTIVFQDCIRFGWRAIRGSDNDTKGFRYTYNKGKRNEKTVLRLFSLVQNIDLGGGRCELIWLASEKLKDLLAQIRSGKGPRWEIPKDFGDDQLAAEYHRQMNGETKREEIDKRGQSAWRWHKTHDNHAWDCEYYQIAVALYLYLLTPQETEIKPEEKQ